MSGLVLEGISKNFGELTAVDDVSLAVPHGTFVCLLGPSGCGKTTLLRMVAGLEVPSAGRILLDGADMTPVPTHKRDFGMVFQSLARSEEHTSELPSLMRTSYAVFCL